jgi:hypothetical protein
MAKRFIPLYRVRSFSDNFTDTFDFMTQNLKPLFRLFVYLLLPICLLQSAGMGGFFENYMRLVTNIGDASQLDSFWDAHTIVGYVVYMLAALLASVMLMSLTYAMMSEYGERKGDLSSVSVRSLWPRLRANLWRSVILILMGIVMMLVVVGVIALTVVISPWLLIAVVPLLLAIAVGLMLWAPVYLFEDRLHVFEALFKAVRYGYHTWGKLFLVLVVMYLIMNIVQSMLLFPSMILMAFKAVLFPTAFENGGFLPLLYTFGTFVLTVVASFATYFFTALFYVAVAYHYGHAAEKLDNVSVVGDIDQFEQLADTHADAPEPTAAGADDIDRFNSL